MGIEQWSPTAASNTNANTGINWDEGMAPSAVNDSARATMADIKEWHIDAEWLKLGENGSANAYSISFVSTTVFKFVGTDRRSLATARRRVKAGVGAGVIYGRIATSSLSASDTQVTVVWDSGVLDASLSFVSVGILNPTNPSQASKAPTRTVLTSGSAATYTTPAGATRIDVQVQGAGSGGNGSGTGSPGLGTAGGNTTFTDGTLTLTGTGGAAPGAYDVGGVGGTPTGGDFNMIGENGGPGILTGTFTGIMHGGDGGTSLLGGRGAMGHYAAAGGAAKTNSGSGGGGAGSNSTFCGPAAGGAAGGYCRKLITSPSASYTYTIGAKGSKGAAGTNGFEGGDGADGIIIVDEFYD